MIGRRWSRSAAALAVILGAGWTAAGGGQEEAPLPLTVHDRVETRMRSVYVTAVRAGRRVLDLEPREIRLRVDGEPREIVTFERGDVPFTALLLIDGSFSMRGEPIAAAFDGARALASDLSEHDLVSVMVFSDRLLLSTPFTGDPVELDEACRNVEPAGGTALFDHLYLAYRRLDRQLGRRVVILLTDGGDAHSVLRAADLEQVARHSDAVVYWIRPGPDPVSSRRVPRDRPEVPADGRPRPVILPTSWLDSDARAGEYRALGELVGESGGRVLHVEPIEEVPGAVAEVLAEVREQYVLGFAPPEGGGDGSWRKLRIRITRPFVSARTRGGYYDR